MSKLEELLNAAAAGETTDLKPQSRMEAYLKACVNGDGADNLPSPQSRADALLIKLAGKMAGGSGGSGGGGIIECDRLPTSNVEEGKIYHARWTEIKEVGGSLTPYIFNGEPMDMSEQIAAIVDSVADVTSTVDDGIPDLCKQDGKLYVLVDGVVTDFIEVMGMSEVCIQLGLVDESFEFNPEEYSVPMATYTVYKQGEIVKIDHDQTGVSPSLSNAEVLQYDDVNDSWVTANAIKTIFANKGDIFAYNNNVKSYKNMIHYSLTSDALSTYEMFANCRSLIEVPLLDTSNVTDMSYMFKNCESLTKVPLFDTSNVTDMQGMFLTCKSLTKVPLFDTHNVIGMMQMFSTCTSLTEVPAFDTRNLYNTYGMFHTCTSLTKVPLFDTSNVMNMSNMFANCGSLIEVPAFDTRNTDIMTNMFNWCSSLTKCWLRNIKTSLQVGYRGSWGHLLTVDSLVHLIYELRDTGSIKTLTVGTANLEKLANVYVKTVEITDEMRAKDDLIDEKLPFVVCESTDEGATLIVDYAKFKNWNIA